MASNTTRMSNVVPFTYQSNEIRTFKRRDGSIWFIAKDVCNVLSIVWKGSGTLGPLDDDEKGTHSVRTPGGKQLLSTINESGLYTLILRSNKPDARPFRRWVTGEVLPAIRKTGQYVQPGLTSAQQRKIQKLVAEKASAISNGKKPTRNAYVQIYRKVKDHFMVPKYSDVPQDRFDELVAFLGGVVRPESPPLTSDRTRKKVRELKKREDELWEKVWELFRKETKLWERYDKIWQKQEAFYTNYIKKLEDRLSL